ncbi:MAG: hypothetical protein F6K65_33535 [Moorea sp. SIO3C2]|nr:hypothetical protein [Moorena sp. SIO3C2]
MSRRKFTAETVLKILEAIEKYGFKKVGAQIAGVDKATLHSWARKHPIFDEAIKDALLKFQRNTVGTELGDLAIAAAKKMLREGKIVKTTMRPGKQTLNRYSAEGRLLYTEVKEFEETVRITHYPPPDHLIKQIIAPYNLDEAIAMIRAAGYEVIDPNDISVSSDQGSGITDDTAALIRGKILGVELDVTETKKLN